LLLADEPTASLDSITQAEIRGLLARLQDSLGLAVLMASHDLAGLAALARRVIVMYAGTPVEEGTPEQVFADPLHPYSRGLARAFPRIARGVDAPLAAIPGSPPDPGRLPPGCAFEPRCADRLPECALRPPRETSTADGRRVRCVKHGS
jgi:oligopeptide/dipeptide ABC transporter ATP-binding protein